MGKASGLISNPSCSKEVAGRSWEGVQQTITDLRSGIEETPIEQRADARGFWAGNSSWRWRPFVFPTAWLASLQSLPCMCLEKPPEEAPKWLVTS